MPLDLTHLHRPEQWLIGRDQYPAKVKQVKWLQQFNDGISSIDTDKNLSVSYFMGHGDLTYLEGTPIFHWFKLTKQGFFITHGYDNEEWKQYIINPNIREIIHRNGINKWTADNRVLDIEPGFILFPIQTFSAQLKLIAEILKWANTNKTRVLFRPHPYPQETLNEYQIWLKLLSKIGINETYVTFSSKGNIDDLVNKCSAVWTHNSGVGMQGLLQNKPVAYFLKDYDHTYGNVATFCKTVEEAANAPIPNPKDVDRFFSWYYDKVIIDLSADDHLERMQERIDGI